MGAWAGEEDAGGCCKRSGSSEGEAGRRQGTRSSLISRAMMQEHRGKPHERRDAALRLVSLIGEGVDREPIAGKDYLATRCPSNLLKSL